MAADHGWDHGGSGPGERCHFADQDRTAGLRVRGKRAGGEQQKDCTALHELTPEFDYFAGASW